MSTADSAVALEDLASEFGVFVDDMFIPEGDHGICPCDDGMAGESGLCESCYDDLMWYTSETYVDPQETLDYWEV